MKKMAGTDGRNNISRMYFLRILASLTFFTRLPFWRLANIPRECYEHVVPFWPLAGWITGGAMALVCWCALWLELPVALAVVLSLCARMVATGALHEDGWADVCDGFGGGTSRERVLEIMKDSHIGSYGVLGLIVYFLLMTLSLSSMPPTLLPFIMLCGDVWAKWTSSNIVNILPYARDLNGAKNGVVYRRMNLLEAFSCVLFATLPVGLCIALGVALHAVVIAMCLSGFSAAVFFLLMKIKIGGYTGDCCGAVCLLSEMVFHLALLTVVGISSPFGIPA